jgi:UDPglucose--hexose-1-phosphate uridylyltransferase
MSQLRLNPLTGRWVTVAVDRLARPDEFLRERQPVETGPARPCPFCPGHEEATPPALETDGRGGEWSMRVVPNRYPAFDGTEPMAVRNLGPVFTEAPASGIHEIFVYRRTHDGGWADLDDSEAGQVMATLRDRLEDHAGAAGVRYTQAIVNHGREAGASLAHPHGQLLGVPFVPGEVAEEEAGFRRFDGSCLLCTMAEAERAAGERVIHDGDGVLVVCPYWSGTPFEMLVVPDAHGPHLTGADGDDLAAVGRALRTVLGKLRDSVGDVAHNLVFHTLPHRHQDPFHWHVHVLPRMQSVGGFEQGTGVPINIVAPERAAARLSG